MKKIIFILSALFLLQINVALAYGPSDPCAWWGSACSATEMNIYIKNSSKNAWHFKGLYMEMGEGWRTENAHPAIAPGGLALILVKGDGISGKIKLTNKGKTVTLSFFQAWTFLSSEVKASSDSNFINKDWCKEAQAFKHIPGSCSFTIN